VPDSPGLLLSALDHGGHATMSTSPVYASDPEPAPESAFVDGGLTHLVTAGRAADRVAAVGGRGRSQVGLRVPLGVPQQRPWRSSVSHVRRLAAAASAIAALSIFAAACESSDEGS